MSLHIKEMAEALPGRLAATFFSSGPEPAGGYMLWIELPSRVDGLKLHRAALLERISILPGVLFSATGWYKSCIRINCGRVWTKYARPSSADSGAPSREAALVRNSSVLVVRSQFCICTPKQVQSSISLYEV